MLEFLKNLKDSLLNMQNLYILVKIIIILIISLIASRSVKILSKKIISFIKKGKRLTRRESEQRANTLVQVINQFAKLIIYVFAIFIILSEIGIDIKPLLAGLGIMGLALSFGAQNLIRDYISGFFILLENQYRIGDVIKVKDVGGIVEKITLRVTTLRDLEGVVHTIPNGIIQRVSNMTYAWSRAKIDIGIAYKEDIDYVIKILKEISKEYFKDPEFEEYILEEPTILGVEELGESQVTIRVLIKTVPLKQWDVAREFRRRVKKRFDEENIEIPFPHRTIYYGEIDKSEDKK